MRRGVRKLVSGRGLSVSSAAPAIMPRQPNKAARECFSGLRLYAQAAFVMVLAGGAVGVRAEMPVCPALLMDSECAQYQQRLTLASNETLRSQILRDYAQLQSERRRACPISEKLEQQILQLRAARQQYGQVD